MRIYIIILLSIILFGCRPGNSERLSIIEQLSSTDPITALDSLNSIDNTQLSAKDNRYYQFLKVKVADKAYVPHTSDSLIISIIDSESKHKGDGRYAEALYYGGRVYSDLGDYPTALKYFQQALDLVESSKDLTLENRVLSQTGRLLNSLRLYDKASEYLIRAIQVDSILGDSLNYMYDVQLLGAINLHAKKFDEAETYFKLARKYAENISHDDIYLQDMYIAGIKYYEDDIDSALRAIRPVMDSISRGDREVALAYASYIYLKAGIADTAFIYANELISNPDYINHELGYRILLSPELKSLTPNDSVYPYINKYFSLIEHELNQHSTQEALIQNAFYNYQIHQQNHLKTIEKNNKLKQIIVFFIISVLVLIIIVIYLKNRNKATLIKLHEAIANLKALRSSLTHNEDSNPIQPAQEAAPCKIIQDSNVELLKKQLQEELMTLLNSRSVSRSVAPLILKSDAYAKLQEHVSNQKIIVESNPLWKELDEVVTQSSPKFKYHLQLLTGGKLKEADYNITLLIKCGIKPTQMTFLIGRTKGTISYRRESICFKIFGQKMGSKVLDDIIFSL